MFILAAPPVMKRARYVRPLEDYIEKEPNSGCWLWTAHVDRLGYGHVTRGGQNQRVHRVMYELAKGPIPEGLTIDHLCRVRSCVNPEHMEPVTQRVNVLRGEANAAKNARKTHCQNGHEFEVMENGWRYCRSCGNELSKGWYYAHREAVLAEKKIYYQQNREAINARRRKPHAVVT